MSDGFLAFGPFQLSATGRSLLRDGKTVRLGNRALALLAALAERAGEPVTKEELIERVWPGVLVEENNLRVLVATLRKLLDDGGPGERFIGTVAGRGYCFVAEVSRGGEAVAPAASAHVAGAVHNLPAPLTRTIGRDQEVALIAAQLPRRRFVTIIGPGGIGKTTIATAVAEAARASYADGVWFVGLAALSSPDLVPSALGAVLGVSLPAADPISGLTAWLRDKQILIVLDNCEHVVGAAAALAAEIVKSAPGACMLATSREPLRAGGEWRHRLAPLAFPSTSTGLAASEALRYSAVELFHERALASADEFVINDGDIQAVVEICRTLDGVPLALELAAAYAGVLGVKDLAARLHDRPVLQIQGRRTALPRHQTLRAMLDWSHDFLPEAEQVVLRRLAVFHGDFTMDAATAVAADGRLPPEQVIDGVVHLVDKSLVAADIGGDVTYYHLLEITRTYALERLQHSGEREAVMRSHADYHRDLFARAEAGAAARSKGEWFADYGRRIGNLRAALGWAFSPGGDAALGVSLAAVATDCLIAMSLLSECCDWGGKAVSQLGAAEGTRDEMMLQCGLGQALTYSRGMQVDARVAWTRALTLAEALGDESYQFRALYGLWLFALRAVDFRECLAQARKCGLLAQTTGDPSVIFATDFMFGLTQFYLGEHAAAAARLQRARATYPTAMRGGDPIRYGADLLANSLGYQALTWWSLGFAERAFRAGRDSIREARGVNHPASLCIALAAPSSILLVKMGYLEEAERCIEELIDHAERHSLTPYHAFGLCSKGGLVAASGDVVEAERLLRFGLRRSRAVAYYLFDAFFQGELAAVLGSADRIDEGLVEIDAALRYAEQSESLWCMPELLRIKGELLAKPPAAEARAAEHWFFRSLDLASQQEALSWKLRTAISLARFWRDRGRAAEAHALLDGVYRKFTEGFDAADLRAAQALLRQLSRQDAL